MLDLDRLFAGTGQAVEVGAPAEVEGMSEAIPTGLGVGMRIALDASADAVKLPKKVGIPTAFPPVPTQGGNAKPNAGAGFRGVPTVPTVPTSKKREPESKPIAPAGVGAASSFRAVVAEVVGDSRCHEINPAAVVLCFHAMTAMDATDAEMGEALRTLAHSPPSEQQRTWSDVCEARGLVPWRLLTFAAVEEERDCMGCANLRSLSGPVNGNERRRFRWGCALGYPIREVARASERIITAPPECRSWHKHLPAAL